MVNVGLRAYIWQQKSLEQQTAREVRESTPHADIVVCNSTKLVWQLQLWSLNDATYEGYRQYVRSGLCLAAVEPLTGAYIITFLYRCSHCKEVGFPAQKALQISRRPSSAGKHAGQASASSLASTSSQAPTPFIFTGLSGNTSACTSDTSVSKPTRSDYFQAADTAFRAAYVRATCHWSKGTLYYGGTHQKYHDVRTLIVTTT